MPHLAARTWDDAATLELGLLIREVETTLLRFFSEGRVNGTVHTCLGQEYSAIAFAGQALPTDYVFSSHRCHGHFIAATGRYEALIAEVLGKRTGVCGGVGSSQHLHSGRFFSNGIQGGIVPLAAGAAFASKLRGEQSIAIVFIGDGTLGEGVLYETLNIAAKWQLPLLVVCENNRYAQTTPLELGVAGSIEERARAFGIETMRGATWEPQRLLDLGRTAIDRVRASSGPLFVVVDTDRIAPHSKGDDTRDRCEVLAYEERDPLSALLREHPRAAEIQAEVRRRVEQSVARAEADDELPLEAYYEPFRDRDVRWSPMQQVYGRQVDLINQFFRESLATNTNILFIGEDVLSPYGGAFKVAKNLSELFPDRVISTPISEAAIVGIGNGLALAGMRPFVELMFGDFTALAFDQLLNHAAKFAHMYNHQVHCPIVVRAPMGGRRGYGPTHSQSLDKFLLGIDQMTVVALNTLVDPTVVYAAVLACRDPVFVVENKLDYGRQMQADVPAWLIAEISDEALPLTRLRPDSSTVDITIVTYGGMVNEVITAAQMLFEEHEILAEIFIPTALRPLNLQPIERAVRTSGRILVAEEGSAVGGFGGELIASIAQRVREARVGRIGALPVPIPSARGLESGVLPSAQEIVRSACSLVDAR